MYDKYKKQEQQNNYDFYSFSPADSSFYYTVWKETSLF